MPPNSAPARKSFIKRNRFKLIASAIVISIIISLFGSFGSSSYCNLCGRKLSRIEIFIPYTDLKIFQWTTISDSPVSIALTKNKIVSDHSHNWEFVYGSGNGIMCAIGPARHYAGALVSEDVAAIIDTMSVHHEIPFRDELIRRAFDPDRSSDLFMVISDQNRAVHTSNSVPTNDEIKAFIKESLEEWKLLDEMRGLSSK